jgi:hypothetical protein
MLKSKGKTYMVEEPSHLKQMSLNHVCKIGLNDEHNVVHRSAPIESVAMSKQRLPVMISKLTAA